jgi:hypothetical protein
MRAGRDLRMGMDGAGHHSQHHGHGQQEAEPSFHCFHKIPPSGNRLREKMQKDASRSSEESRISLIHPFELKPPNVILRTPLRRFSPNFTLIE